MYLTLPESSGRRQRSAGGTVLSAVLHAAVIGATVVGTGISAPRPSKPTPPEDLIFVVPPDDVKPTRPPLTPPPVSPPISPDTPPLVPPEIVPPPVLTIEPAVVPTTLPDLEARLGAVVEPRPLTTNGTGDGTPTGPGTGVADGAPMSALAVDREVVVRDGAVPRYPSMLVSAGIEGVVLARFVVDTLGRVERPSIELTSNAHPMFAQSVREALERMRFVPAESQGRKVRQLVQQPFTFEITRR